METGADPPGTPTDPTNRRLTPMADTTLIVTLPDGSTATRTTPRAYVSAVVFRYTEAEAVAAEAKAARAEAALTPELLASFDRLVEAYQAASAPIKAGHDRQDTAARAWGEAKARGEDPGAYPELGPARSLWPAYERACAAIYKHPAFAVRKVEGIGGAALVGEAAWARSVVGQVGVLVWNQRLDLSHAAINAERGKHPLRELQVVPTAVAPKAPKAPRKAKA